MGEESSEMNPEGDKTLLEKNKKRIVKTRDQVEALEKFYNEHKYPSESMKIQLAESIGLTEKQVSGWFCHRRLKDKKLINGENYAIGRQDQSTGVIQDRGSGHRQDSCGSTKQGDDRNIDTREVESGRFTSKEISAAHVTYEHGIHYAGSYNQTDDASSGSSSSLQNITNYQNGGPSDAASSRYLIPKFSADTKVLKTRSGPSGYLKVKGQVENGAVTAVKRQLGKHYREDGPSLAVEFDPLPPGAFESSTKDPVDENFRAGEAVHTASPDSSNFHQNPKFCKESEYRSSRALCNSSINDTNPKRRRGSDIPDIYIHQKSRTMPSFSITGAYRPRSYSSLELHEVSARDVRRHEYGSRHGPGLEVNTMDSVSGCPNPQPYGGNMTEKRAESCFRKYDDVGTRVALGVNTETEYSNLTMKRNEYLHSSGVKGLSKEITKDGKAHPWRRIINENEIKGPRRKTEEIAQQQHLITSPVVDNLTHTYQVIRPAREMPSSFSEDEESSGTSSSVD